MYISLEIKIIMCVMLFVSYVEITIFYNKYM